MSDAANLLQELPELGLLQQQQKLPASMICLAEATCSLTS
jgi:hypothetical protein